jgi:hypothetical protein
MTLCELCGDPCGAGAFFLRHGERCVWFDDVECLLIWLENLTDAESSLEAAAKV